MARRHKTRVDFSMANTRSAKKMTRKIERRTIVNNESAEIIRMLNAEFDADFDVSRFEHRAVYDEEHGRIEMHLVSRDEQTVTVAGVPPAGLFLATRRGLGSRAAGRPAPCSRGRRLVDTPFPC